MKRVAAHFAMLGVLVAAVIAALTLPPRPPVAPGKVAPKASFLRLPLTFEPNRGQADPSVRFVGRAAGYVVMITDREAVLRPRGTGRALRLQLEGSGTPVAVEALDPLPGVVNYFLGSDPAKWRTRIPTCARVALRGVYPGVDMVYYGSQRNLEYDFVVAPGADPDRIRLRVAGADRLRLAEDGSLRATLGGREVVMRRPDVYQEMDGRRVAIDAGWVLGARGSVRFAVAAHDPRVALVIDPPRAVTCYGSNIFQTGNFLQFGYRLLTSALYCCLQEDVGTATSR